MSDEGKSYVFTVRTNPESMLPMVDFFVDVTPFKGRTAEEMKQLKTVYRNMGATDMVDHITGVERALSVMQLRHRFNVDMSSQMYCIHVDEDIDTDTLEQYIAAKLRLGQLRTFLDSAKI